MEDYFLGADSEKDEPPLPLSYRRALVDVCVASRRNFLNVFQNVIADVVGLLAVASAYCPVKARDLRACSYLLSGRVFDLSDAEVQEEVVDSVLKDDPQKNIRLNFIEQHYLDALGEVRVKLEQVIHAKLPIGLSGVSVTIVYNNFIRPWQFCDMGTEVSLKLQVKSDEVSSTSAWLAGIPEEATLNVEGESPVKLIRLGGGQRSDKYISVLISEDNEWIVELGVQWNGPPESQWWEYIPSMANVIF